MRPELQNEGILGFAVQEFLSLNHLGCYGANMLDVDSEAIPLAPVFRYTNYDVPWCLPVCASGCGSSTYLQHSRTCPLHSAPVNQSPLYPYLAVVCLPKLSKSINLRIYTPVFKMVNFHDMLCLYVLQLFLTS
jgi:hypothetical protein